jgi:hypothetical protein
MFRELPPLEKRLLSDEDYGKLFDDLKKEQPHADSPSGIPAGYTYFGQFVAHDITFNPISSLTQRRDPESIVSFRTPRLDLDSLYGRGPKDSPYFYEPARASSRVGRLSVGWGLGSGEEDLPRTEGEPAVALIGDSRNDDNTMISQLHLAFIRLHNKILDEPNADFDHAQRMTRWHYQWVILNDYLPRICDRQVLNEIWSKSDRKNGTEPKLRWFTWKVWPFVPLEFSGAAFRFGHSMVRDTYQLNFKHAPIPVFGGGSLGNLQGFRRLPFRWTVQWDHFLEFDGDKTSKPKLPQESNLIDSSLALSLEDLPSDVLGIGAAGEISKARRELRARNIERGYQLDLPSGQAVARAMSMEGKDLLGEICDGGDPLWVYILREAGLQNEGKRLGKVGSTIVAETIIGLIAGDPLSYVKVDPRWKPTLRPGETFELRDLIRAAGMPITERDLRSIEAFSDSKYDPRASSLDGLRTAEAKARAQESGKARVAWLTAKSKR